MGKYELREKPACNRYEYDLGGATAYVEYELDGNIMTLTHTIVPPAFSGQGIGAQLLADVLEDVRRKGYRIIPQCRFVEAYIERHPEWRDRVVDTVPNA